MARLLSDEEVTRQVADLDGWRREGDTLVTAYTSPDFPAAIALVSAAADAAEQMQHHPDIDIRWTTTRWSLSTHSEGGLTQLDIELAHRIAGAARRSGAVTAGESGESGP